MRYRDRYKNVSTLVWSWSTRMKTTPNIAAQHCFVAMLTLIGSFYEPFFFQEPI